MRMSFDDLVKDAIDEKIVTDESLIEEVSDKLNTDIYDEWLNKQFERYGLYYCITCGKFTDSMDCLRDGHELAQSVEEMVEKQVMNRLKGG